MLVIYRYTCISYIWKTDSSPTCSVIYRRMRLKQRFIVDMFCYLSPVCNKSTDYRRYVLMFIASMQYEHQSSPTCSVANIIWFNTDMSCDISQNKLIHRKHVLMFISSMQYEHWFIADMFWCLYRQYFKKVFKRKEFELVFIVRWNFFCFI